MLLHPPTAIYLNHVSILYYDCTNGLKGHALTTVNSSNSELSAVSISDDVVYQDTLRESTSRSTTHQIRQPDWSEVALSIKEWATLKEIKHKS